MYAEASIIEQTARSVSRVKGSADYQAGYDYDDVTGRMNLITAPGLYAGGATVSYTAYSDLVSQIGFKGSSGSVVATINKTYETNRDLVASVSNKIGSTPFS